MDVWLRGVCVLGVGFDGVGMGLGSRGDCRAVGG